LRLSEVTARVGHVRVLARLADITLRHREILREARWRQLAAERAHASLSRYFSPNLAERLADGDDGIDLAGQRREAASLFTDVAGTSLVVRLCRAMRIALRVALQYLLQQSNGRLKRGAVAQAQGVERRA
jgi:hypothetical protein